MSTQANEVKKQAAAVIEANEVKVDDTKTAPVIPTVKPQATTGEITAFIVSKLPAPASVSEAIDTSDIDLRLYRTEDADINAVYNDCGWSRIQLVADNEEGKEVIIPHARLKITNSAGNSYKVPPFFFAVLLARKSTIELSKESQLKQFAEQGSMKARGTTHRFVASKEQLDALQAKAQMQWEIDCKALAERFTQWLGSFHPTVDLLDTLYTAFASGAVLVSLAADKVFIRQTIQADSEQLPLDLPELELVTTTPDQIGDVLISTCYTFQVKLA